MFKENRDEKIRDKFYIDIMKIIVKWVGLVLDFNLLQFKDVAFIKEWNSFMEELGLKKIDSISNFYEKLNKNDIFEQNLQSIPKLEDWTPFQVDCLNHKTEVLANVFTQSSSDLFFDIPIDELLHNKWSKPEWAPHYDFFVENFNNIFKWSATQVLTRKSSSERIKVIEKLTKVATNCVESNDYHTSFAIFSGK